MPSRILPCLVAPAAAFIPETLRQAAVSLTPTPAALTPAPKQAAASPVCLDRVPGGGHIRAPLLQGPVLVEAQHTYACVVHFARHCAWYGGFAVGWGGLRPNRTEPYPVPQRAPKPPLTVLSLTLSPNGPPHRRMAAGAM